MRGEKPRIKKIKNRARGGGKPVASFQWVRQRVTLTPRSLLSLRFFPSVCYTHQKKTSHVTRAVHTLHTWTPKKNKTHNKKKKFVSSLLLHGYVRIVVCTKKFSHIPEKKPDTESEKQKKRELPCTLWAPYSYFSFFVVSCCCVFFFFFAYSKLPFPRSCEIFLPLLFFCEWGNKKGENKNRAVWHRKMKKKKKRNREKPAG